MTACAVGAALTSVSFADDGVTDVTASATVDVRVVGVDEAVVADDGVVAAMTVECVDLDPVLAGVDVGCWVCGAGVTGVALT
jgi:hypothetical protein